MALKWFVLFMCLSTAAFGGPYTRNTLSCQVDLDAEPTSGYLAAALLKMWLATPGSFTNCGLMQSGQRYQYYGELVRYGSLFYVLVRVGEEYHVLFYEKYSGGAGKFNSAGFQR